MKYTDVLTFGLQLNNEGLFKCVDTGMTDEAEVHELQVVLTLGDTQHPHSTHRKLL